MTPAALASCGDCLGDRNVRVHLGVPHMIIVSEISGEIIEEALRDLEAAGALEEHTMLIVDQD
ncbi:MAG: hypothetical protein OES24_10750 [Acidimicrobiia bacterium]|nr:hypothetical protein [Acidimicrobiia bacterium]